jgi:hypothetical protein
MIQYPPQPPTSWETTTTAPEIPYRPIPRTGSEPSGTIIVAAVFLAVGIGLVLSVFCRRDPRTSYLADQDES